MSDGRVEFDIVGNDSGINKTVKNVTSTIQSESKKWDDVAKSGTSGIEKSFSSMVSSVVGKLTAAGVGAVLLNWGSSAIQAASDLAEVQNVVDTVFGDGAAKIEAWSKAAGRQFGLTETQAKKFTSTLGAMMKSSGLAGDEIVSMSTDLAGLASDMASFYNLSFDEAFDKIRSGLSGVTMPLKQLGIDMSVANLNAFALAQGMEKTFDKMDQGEQTMLRYQYMMHATADAQGDFEKTSDGFANAQRRIQTAIDSIQTSLGTILLPVVENVTGAVASFLESITSQPERTVLDDFNDIEVDTSKKLADLQETYNKAQDIINVLDEISKQTVTLKDGSETTFEELFKDLGNVEANGGDVRGYLESLGLDVDEVINKYNQWKESTKQLTSLVPSLTSSINSETHAIEGGTDALQENLDEWKKQQEARILWAAYYAKKEALATSEASVWQLQLDVMGKEQAKKRIRKTLEDIGTVFDEAGRIDTSQAFFDASKVAEGFDINDYIDMAAEYEDAVNAEEEATDRYTTALEANAQAHQELQDEYDALVESLGEEEKATKSASEATSSYLNKNSSEWQTNITAITEATKALREYYEGVLEGTQQSVNATLKGFEKVEKAGESLRRERENVGSELAQAELKYSKVLEGVGGFDAVAKMDQDAWNKLKPEVQDAYNEIARLRKEQQELNESLNQYKPEGMKAGLESQIKFMEDYLSNLEQLQEWGISNEMLASLSDGSKESAEFLAGLVEGGEDAAKAVGDLYGQVQEKKESFSKALTDQKLTVDETYQGMVDTALAAMQELNMQDEAESAMAGTVEGIANGIALNVPEVRAAVDSLLAELDRLNTYGMGFDFGSDGWAGITMIPQHETGLNFVPYDGYLASLHEGEGILTAEENRIWQRFKNGQTSHGNVDYDALGGVMRDNVKPGGDVFLDGRRVGKVVSDIQGEQYRSLQRSGWQS